MFPFTDCPRGRRGSSSWRPLTAEYSTPKLGEVFDVRPTDVLTLQGNEHGVVSHEWWGGNPEETGLHQT